MQGTCPPSSSRASGSLSPACTDSSSPSPGRTSPLPRILRPRPGHELSRTARRAAPRCGSRFPEPGYGWAMEHVAEQARLGPLRLLVERLATAYPARLAGITALGAMARFLFLSHQPLWRDEAFTAVV